MIEWPHNHRSSPNSFRDYRACWLQELNIFLKLLGKYDIVQGVRVVPDRILSHIPFIRSIYRIRGRSDNLKKALISLTNYYVLKVFFQAPLDDFQNITFYKTKYVQSLKIQANTPFINPELIIKSYLNGKSIIEVPINFIPRSMGVGKGTRLKILVRTVFDILKGFFLWRLGKSYKAAIKKIDRVSNPFELDQEVLEIVVPLFKKFNVQEKQHGFSYDKKVNTN
jgi:hypothetical protein